MLKLSKITLLLLAGLGISSLSGCGTLALLNQCFNNPESDARCGSDESLHVGLGHIQTPDVAVTADTLAKLASVAQSEDVVGIRSAVLADIEEPPISTELVEQVAYTEKTFENSNNDGFAFYSFESDSHEPADENKVIAFDGSEPHREAFKYVGVLPSTDVGNALRNYNDIARDEYGNVALSAYEEIPLIATWTGRVTVVVPEMSYSTYYVEKDNAGERTNNYYDEVGYVPATSNPFNLIVNFKTQEISSETIQIPVTDDDDAYNRTARIWGDFGVSSGSNGGKVNNELAPGQLSGYFDFLDDDIFQTPMTGIIGEKGAVGVFNGAYFGGFVASPK